MSQHFLLSKEARTLSLISISRLSDDEAYNKFKSIRWVENGGEPVCPVCGGFEIGTVKARKLFTCKGCRKQFSVTSGTIFASHKLSIRDILIAIALFVNGAKGHSALQMSRDMNVQYKTAFVMLHKIREALGVHQDLSDLSYHVEIDGAYYGGYVKPANLKEKRTDRRLTKNKNGKRQVMVVLREVPSRTVPTVFSSIDGVGDGQESQAIPEILKRVKPGTIIHADEATAWNVLEEHYQMGRINHQQAYSTPEGCTNWVESFHSRVRRAEIGIHHHIAGPYLLAYGREMAWREDNRRKPNGEQFYETVHAVTHHPVSRQWKGYWQRVPTSPKRRTPLPVNPPIAPDTFS